MLMLKLCWKTIKNGLQESVIASLHLDLISSMSDSKKNIHSPTGSNLPVCSSRIKQDHLKSVTKAVRRVLLGPWGGTKGGLSVTAPSKSHEQNGTRYPPPLPMKSAASRYRVKQELCTFVAKPRHMALTDSPGDKDLPATEQQWHQNKTSQDTDTFSAQSYILQNSWNWFLFLSLSHPCSVQLQAKVT